MADETYTIDNLEQRKQLVGGGSLVDIVHIDYRMANGMPGFVDIPSGNADKTTIDTAIKSKIKTVNDILTLGK